MVKRRRDSATPEKTARKTHRNRPPWARQDVSDVGEDDAPPWHSSHPPHVPHPPSAPPPRCARCGLHGTCSCQRAGEWHNQDDMDAYDDEQSSEEDQEDPITDAVPGSKRRNVATARCTPAGQVICKKWNDQRGCENSRCPKVHACDVLLSGTTVCGALDHNRRAHKWWLHGRGFWVTD